MEREKINWKEVIKEGNLVKVRQFDDMAEEFGVYYEHGNPFCEPCTVKINCFKLFTEKMKKYCGKTIRINSTMETDFNLYGFFHYEGYSISTDMLEPYIVSGKNTKEKLKELSETIDKMTIEELDDMLEESGIDEKFEYKEEKEITIPNIENHGIKENAIYVIKYDDGAEKTFLGENNITFKGKVINFTSDKCYIVDQERGLAILPVKNIISMIPVKIREKN